MRSSASNATGAFIVINMTAIRAEAATGRASAFLIRPCFNDAELRSPSLPDRTPNARISTRTPRRCDGARPAMGAGSPAVPRAHRSAPSASSPAGPSSGPPTSKQRTWSAVSNAYHITGKTYPNRPTAAMHR